MSYFFFELFSIIVIIFTWMIDFFSQKKKLSGFFFRGKYNNAKRFSQKVNIWMTHGQINRLKNSERGKFCYFKNRYFFVNKIIVCWFFGFFNFFFCKTISWETRNHRCLFFVVVVVLWKRFEFQLNK